MVLKMDDWEDLQSGSSMTLTLAGLRIVEMQPENDN